MGDVAFLTLPADVRVPSVLTEVDSSKAIGGPQIKPWKVLLVGQRTSAGTVAALVPKTLTTVDQARGWFGPGSMLHGMALAFFANPHAFDVTAIALDDAGGGTAATLACVVSGPATAAGTIAFYVGGYRAVCAVANGDASTTIATNLAAAINKVEGCPVSAVASSSTVTLTALNKGLVGNEIDVRVNYFDGEVLPAGVAITNTSSTPLAGGATNPTIGSSLWTALGQVPYDLMAIPYADTASTTAIDTEMASRWNYDRQIECSAVMARRDTHANLLTFGAALNSKFISVVGVRGMVDPPWEYTAAYAANRSFFARNDPARPLRSIQLFGLNVPAVADQFTFAERDLLYRNGVAATVAVASAIVFDRTVTTYQKSAAGAADPAFLDITTVDTLAYQRWSFRNRMLLRFPRHKVVDDGTRVANSAVASPKTVRAEIVALFEEWMSLGLVEDVVQFKRDLVVQRNSGDPTRIDCVLPVNEANPLFVIASSLQFRL